MTLTHIHMCFTAGLPTEELMVDNWIFFLSLPFLSPYNLLSRWISQSAVSLRILMVDIILLSKECLNFCHIFFPQCLKRITVMCPTVKKTALWLHLRRTSWVTIWQKALTAAGSVEETVTRCLLFRSTCEFTRVRNLTSAVCVGSSSPRKVNSKVTWKSTRGRSRSPARTAGRASPTRAPWTDTGSRTQESDPTTALCATGASTSPDAWGNTRKSISERSMTVQSVTRVSHELRASRTISGFTQERGRTAATSAGEASAAHKAWGSTDGNMSRVRLRMSLLSVWGTMTYHRVTTTLQLICV